MGCFGFGFIGEVSLSSNQRIEASFLSIFLVALSLSPSPMALYSLSSFLIIITNHLHRHTNYNNWFGRGGGRRRERSSKSLIRIIILSLTTTRSSRSSSSSDDSSSLSFSSSTSSTRSDAAAPGDIGKSNIKRIHLVCSWWWWSCFFSLITFSAASSSPPVTLPIITTTTSTPNSLSFLSSSLPTTTTSTSTSPPPPHIKPPSSIPTPTTTKNTKKKKKKILIVTVSAASSAALALLLLMGCLFIFRRSSKQVEDAELPIPSPTISDPDKDEKLLVTTTPDLDLRRFSWEEIVQLSRNFSTVIGHGGLSIVYLAHFSDSKAALKIHPDSDRLNQIFQRELHILRHLQHPNIVRILGYSQHGQDGMGGALVFEYLPNGNLQQKLHGNEGCLSWKSRMWIAFQLARAIEYLHHNCTLPIVHGDIKASNVLLDHQLNLKLCDFGSAKMGFSATVIPSSSHSLMGSPGYIDPHYMKTGIASKKNDVYSFGVILLELITGLEAFCPHKEQLLTTIAGPLLRGGGDEVNVRPLVSWVKPENLNHSDSRELMIMASISAQCLGQQPSLRPSMADVLTTMTNQISSIHHQHTKLQLV